MYNEEFSHMNKSVQSDVSFYLKVQTAQAKNQVNYLQSHFYAKYNRRKYQ